MGEMGIDTPILITGAARSGTSLTAAMVHMGGAWGGEMSGPTRHNRKGMFENADIRNQLVKPFLTRCGYDPMGQSPIPSEVWMVPTQTDWQARVVEIIKRQGYRGGPWFYKGAKMCLIWNIWVWAFPDARWLIVRRPREEIIDSCLRTGFMRAYSDRTGWGRWLDLHEKRFEEMRALPIRWREVNPNRMINGDFSEMEETMAWLGLPFDLTQAMDFVEPKYWGKGA